MTQFKVGDFRKIPIENYLKGYNLEETLHHVYFPSDENVIQVLPCNLNNAMQEILECNSRISITYKEKQYIGIPLYTTPNDLLNKIIAGYAESDENNFFTPFVADINFFKLGDKKGLVGMTLQELQEFLGIVMTSRKYVYVKIIGGIESVE